MSNSYILTERTISLVIDSKTYTISATHPDADKIRKHLINEEFPEAAAAIDVAKSLKEWSEGDVMMRDGHLYLGDEQLAGPLASRVMQMYREGFNIDPMRKFVANLMSNPSMTAVKELYLFLEHGALPITEDGCFLAYKKVTDSYLDCYTRTIDNSIGKTVEVKRREVDDNRDRTCSYGLHFCAMDYLGSYYGRSGRVVIVKINPRDVVSIPSDYNNTKGRCCKYEVVAEHTMTDKEKTEWFQQSVYGDGYEHTYEEAGDPLPIWWDEDEDEEYDNGYYR